MTGDQHTYALQYPPGASGPLCGGDRNTCFAVAAIATWPLYCSDVGDGAFDDQCASDILDLCSYQCDITDGCVQFSLRQSSDSGGVPFWTCRYNIDQLVELYTTVDCNRVGGYSYRPIGATATA